MNRREGRQMAGFAEGRGSISPVPRVDDTLLRRIVFFRLATGLGQFLSPSFVAGGDRCSQKPAAVAVALLRPRATTGHTPPFGGAGNWCNVQS
jgi:hypothetical protein